MSNETAVVIDDGSGLIKAGFSDSEAPQLQVLPACIVGRSPMHRGQKDFFVGDEAQKKRSVLSLKYPIEHGIIMHWDDMEKLCTYTFSRPRKVDSTSQKATRTKSPQNPKSNGKKMDRVTKNDDMAGNYGLPEIIQGKSERSRCAEVLLQPHLIGTEARDIANAAMKCDTDIRKVLYENIVLSGGYSTFSNIEQRLESKDVKILVSTLVEVDCLAPPERKFSTWIGGAIFTILAILIIFSLIWIQRNKYDKKWHLSHSIGQNNS